jgi:hypothetical protein
MTGNNSGEGSLAAPKKFNDGDWGVSHTSCSTRPLALCHTHTDAHCGGVYLISVCAVGISNVIRHHTHLHHQRNSP